MNNKFILFSLIWVIINSISSLKSNAQDGIYKNGHKFTFEAPKSTAIPVGHTSESWELKRQEIEITLSERKVYFGNLAYGMAQELHQCFRIISDNEKILRLKEAAKRHALSLFKYASGEIPGSTPYFGMVLGENGLINESYVNLGTYMDMLIAQTSRQEGVNICWALPGGESGKIVHFKPAGFSSPILLPNGQKHPENLLYEVYRGSLPVRERIGFLKNGMPAEQIICKEMFFELRCYLDSSPKLNPGAPDKFYWQVSFIRIGKVTDEKKCENLPDVACSLPDLSILAQITQVSNDSLQNNDLTSKSLPPPKAYKPVSPITYLFPGHGLKHFQAMKEKKYKLPIWPVITGMWLGSGFFAIVSKKQSDIDYNIHKKTFSIAENEWSYTNANKWHQRGLISAAACLSIWIINDTHIFLKDSKARRTSKELFMQSIPAPTIGYNGKNELFLNNQPTLGIRLKF
jgi:hypothetical protein